LVSRLHLAPRFWIGWVKYPAQAWLQRVDAERVPAELATQIHRPQKLLRSDSGKTSSRDDQESQPKTTFRHSMTPHE
jgi:hypothetical protein